MSSTDMAWRRDHVADRLPACLNGTLDPIDHADISTHLESCSDCRVSLSAWSAIAHATK